MMIIKSNFKDNNELFVIKELKARGRKAYRNVPMMQELKTFFRHFHKI